METFIERTDDAFAHQLNNFCAKIGGYATILGLDADKITHLTSVNVFLQFVFEQQMIAQQYAQGYTAYKNQLRRGLPGHTIGALPPPPVYPRTTPAVAGDNAQALFADIIQDCVRSAAFTPAIGEDLGIIKPAQPFDPQAGKPVISVRLAQGGHPQLHLTIGKYEGAQVWKDAGDGKGFILSGVALHADYLDLSPLPAQDKSATWRYKMIYLYKGIPAGSWSDEVLVTVYGSV